jgi:heat shock protein HslJ
VRRRRCFGLERRRHPGSGGARGAVLDPDPDAIGGGQTQILDVGVSAEFDGTTISGSAGCNSYHASYEASGGDISFGPIAATKKLCPEDEQSTEDRYLQLLAEIGSYEVSGRSMSMSNTDGTPVLQFMQG